MEVLLWCCNYTLCANFFRKELMRTRQGETFDWGYGFALPRLFSRPQEIRYERKSIIFLWITCLADRQAILGSVFHHHPDNIDQLTAQADQGLRFGFAFGYFFLEICSGRIIARP